MNVGIDVSISRAETVMNQSRSRFPTRGKVAREASRGGADDGEAGADFDADADASRQSGSNRNRDSWDPFASADPQSTSGSDSYTRSSEQTGRRSKRKTGSADDSFDSGKPKLSLKGRALGYLSRREYSRIELAGKLRPYVEESDNLDALLDALELEAWLSDTRFAESLMHRRSGRFGASRIVGELKRHALDGDLLAELGTQLRDTEAARAKLVWQKKFGALPASSAERAKQVRFLAARGFSHTVIARLLGGRADEADFLADDEAD